MDHWGLMRPTPHLALRFDTQKQSFIFLKSIIGGAKNFRLDGRKREVFKKGLIGDILTEW